MEIALAVLLVLSFPIIAIAGLVIAIGARDRVRTLEQRFADFQKARRPAGRRCSSGATVAGAVRARRYRRAAGAGAAATGRAAPAAIPAEPAAPPRPAAAASVPPTSPPPPSAPAEPRWASTSVSAPDGRSGSAASRSRSRASSWFAIRFPGSLLDRTGLVRPRHAHRPRRNPLPAALVPAALTGRTHTDVMN